MCVCECTFVIQLMIGIFGVTQWIAGGLLPSSMCHLLSHRAWNNAAAYVIVEQYVVK